MLKIVYYDAFYSFFGLGAAFSRFLIEKIIAVHSQSEKKSSRLKRGGLSFQCSKLLVPVVRLGLECIRTTCMNSKAHCL